jgi:hypothetical protein
MRPGTSRRAPRPRSAAAVHRHCRADRERAVADESLHHETRHDHLHRRSDAPSCLAASVLVSALSQLKSGCGRWSSWIGVVTVNDVLDGYVVLEIECLDRIYLNAYLPILQTSA